MKLGKILNTHLSSSVLIYLTCQCVLKWYSNYFVIEGFYPLWGSDFQLLKFYWVGVWQVLVGVIKVIAVFVVLLVFFLMRIIGVDCLVVQQPCMFHYLFVV